MNFEIDPPRIPPDFPITLPDVPEGWEWSGRKMWDLVLYEPDAQMEMDYCLWYDFGTNKVLLGESLMRSASGEVPVEDPANRQCVEDALTHAVMRILVGAESD